MAKYTVQDTTTGKNVTFEWNDPTPPTDADMEEVFSAARGGEEPKLSAGDVVTGAITNIPESAGNMVKGIANTVRHPIDTVEGLGNIVRGGIEKLIPGESPKEANFDAVINFFKDRYGGEENLKKTIATDPVGFAADLSTIFTGGGALLKASGLAKAGNVVSKAGGLVDPVNAVVNTGRAVSKGVAKLPLTSPERLYASAVKPPKNIKKTSAQLKKEISIGLDEGILPNEGGLEKLNKTVSEIEGVQETAVSAKMPYFVSKDEALQHVPDIIAEYQKKSVFPAESKSIIESATKKFIEEHGDWISLDHAVNMKKGIYEDLRGKYGKQTTAPSEMVDWNKAVARGLKDSVYKAVVDANPSLKALGEKEGALLGLKSAIESGAQRISKRDIMGIGVPIKTGVGMAVGKAIGSETVGALAGAAAGIIDTPIVKARLAVALNKSRKKSLNTRTSKTRMVAYQSGKNQ